MFLSLHNLPSNTTTIAEKETPSITKPGVALLLSVTMTVGCQDPKNQSPHKLKYITVTTLSLLPLSETIMDREGRNMDNATAAAKERLLLPSDNNDKTAINGVINNYKIAKLAYLSE